MWTWFQETQMKIPTQFTTVPFNRYLSSNKEEIIIFLSQSVFHYSSTSHIYPEVLFKKKRLGKIINFLKEKQ